MRRLWREVLTGIYKPLPAPDPSAVRRPVIDRDWEVGQARVRWTSGALAAAALAHALRDEQLLEAGAFTYPVRQVSPDELDRLWEGQQGEMT